MSYWSPEYDGSISMTLFLVPSIDRERLRINMGVDRIIFLLGIIRVIENHAAPYESSGLLCSGFEWKYVFVLNPVANETNLLIDLVQSVKSPIVKTPEFDDGSVQVVISLEDFADFKRKSESSKLYSSHSLQCVDPKRNVTIANRNTPRSSTAWTQLNGTARKYSSTEVTNLLTQKAVAKALDEKMWETSKNHAPESSRNIKKASASQDIEKSLKRTASVSMISVGSSTSRISRATKMTTKRPTKGTSNLKSNDKSVSKLPKQNTRPKFLEQNKSMKNNDTSHSRKKTKAKAGNERKTLIPTRRTLTLEPWNRLLSMAEKSLSKSNSSSSKSTVRKENQSYPIARGKVLSSAKIGNARKAMTSKKNPSKQTKRPNVKNTRISGSKTSVTRKSKSSSVRNRLNQQGKSVPKRQRRRKSLSAENPKTRKITVVNNGRENRKSRELRISASPSANCGENYARKKKRSPYVDEELTIDVPIACVVIKISSTCEPDCPEDGQEIAHETDVEYTTPKIPAEVPIPSPESELKPIEPPKQVVEETSIEPGPIESPDEKPDELFDPESTKPEINLPGSEEYKETLDYTEEFETESSTKPVDVPQLPEELPNVPADHPESSHPGFDEYPVTPSSFPTEDSTHPTALSTKPEDEVPVQEDPSYEPIDYPEAAPPLSSPNLDEYPETVPPLSSPNLGEYPATVPPLSSQNLDEYPETVPPLSSPNLGEYPATVPPLSSQNLDEYPATVPPLSSPNLDEYPEEVPPFSSPNSDEHPATVPPFSHPNLDEYPVTVPPISSPNLDKYPATVPPFSSPNLDEYPATVPPFSSQNIDEYPETVPPFSSPNLNELPATVPPFSSPNLDEHPATVPPFSLPSVPPQHSTELSTKPDGFLEFPHSNYGNYPTGIPPPLLPDESVEDATRPQGYLRQSVANTWPKTAFPSLNSQITFPTPASQSAKPPETPFKVPGGAEAEVDDVDYDGDDKEKNDKGLTENKDENGLDLLKLPKTSFEPQINHGDKFIPVSLKNNGTKAGEGLKSEDDYDDEDYDVKDYNEYDENHEDNVEDDYKFDKD